MLFHLGKPPNLPSHPLFFLVWNFRAINLVFPNFLTGLEQNNSSLLLSGLYITLNISGF